MIPFTLWFLNTKLHGAYLGVLPPGTLFHVSKNSQNRFFTKKNLLFGEIFLFIVKLTTRLKS